MHCRITYKTEKVFCRQYFWDVVTDDYQVDMTPLKEYATHCTTRRSYQEIVQPKDILAGAVQIQHFNLETMTTEDSQLAKVGNFFQLKRISFYPDQN